MTDLTAKLKRNSGRPVHKANRSALLRAFSRLIAVSAVSALLITLPAPEYGYSIGFASSAQAANVKHQLTNVEAKHLDNNSIVVDVAFKDTVPEINHFMLADPPRVIVDLPGASNQTDQRIVQISKGSIESVMLVTNEERVRVVVNLFNESTFNAEKIDQGYRFHFGQVSQTATNTKSASSPKAVNAPGAQKMVPARLMIGDVDFRRTPDGRGRVIVPLADPNTIVDFKEEAGELVANFLGVSIEDKDEKRLDVVDFATPVNSIEIFRHKNNVRMVVTPTGQYKHTVTQDNNNFIIEVAPLTKQELTAREQSESGYSGETLSLNFQRIPVRAALQVIADFTGFNIITSDSVEGDLSLRLNDVPWDQALDLILQSKNLSMRQKGNVIRIAPSEEIAAQEKADFEAQKEVVDLEPLETALIRVNFAKAEDLAELIKSIEAVSTEFEGNATAGGVAFAELKTREDTFLSARGSVTADERTNTLMVRDTPSHIAGIRELVRQLDIPVQQVQIETRIVAATDSFSRNLGARLGFTRVTQDARFPGASDTNSLGTVFGSGSIEATGELRSESEVLYPDALSVNLAADGIGNEVASSYAYQIAKLGAGYLHLLDLEISALQAEGNGKIIANPKLTTTNKHEAVILQGQERIIAGEVRQAILSLGVVPQITPDNNVILDVAITNDSFVSPTDSTINTKRIVTQTLLADGETIVIGGIFEQNQLDSTTKTPILGDIPLLGNLFKKRSKRDDRTELLIFLTPRILKTGF